MTTKVNPPGEEPAGQQGKSQEATGKATAVIVTEPTPQILHWTGCPSGCGTWHECGVGEPIDDIVDYSLSAVWVGNPPKLSDLRSTAVAA